jgi:hypothetical protein
MDEAPEDHKLTFYDDDEPVPSRASPAPQAGNHKLKDSNDAIFNLPVSSTGTNHSGFADTDGAVLDWELGTGWGSLSSRRRPFLSIRARPTPTLVYFVSNILFLYLGSSAHPNPVASMMGNLVEPLPKESTVKNGSVPFQVLLMYGITIILVLLKSVWIPNPKDDVLAVASLKSRAQRYGFIGVNCYLSSVTTIFALYAAGPIPILCILVCIFDFQNPIVSLPLKHVEKRWPELGLTIANMDAVGTGTLLILKLTYLYTMFRRFCL